MMDMNQLGLASWEVVAKDIADCYEEYCRMERELTEIVRRYQPLSLSDYIAYRSMPGFGSGNERVQSSKNFDKMADIAGNLTEDWQKFNQREWVELDSDYRMITNHLHWFRTALRYLSGDEEKVIRMRMEGKSFRDMVTYGDPESGKKYWQGKYASAIAFLSKQMDIAWTDEFAQIIGGGE